MKLLSLVALFVSVCASVAFSQEAKSDPVFAGVPLEKWLQPGEQALFHWSAHLTHPQLSLQQRLLTQVEVKVDGAELAKRRGKGELVILVQFKTDDGRRYQDHGALNLEKVEESIKKSDVEFSQSAFVLPGDYSITIVILDTATQEHAAKLEKLEVAPLKNDPLPDAWRDLPPVEFIPAADIPDSWFLPSVQGRLNLPVVGSHPVHLTVLANVTNPTKGSNTGAVFSALKVLSQVKVQDGSVEIGLVDLSRQRVIFDEGDARHLDFERLRDSLSQSGTATIDVKSLSERSHSAAFMLKEIDRRLQNSQAVIVLSDPVAFGSGEDLRGVHIEGAPGIPVYYLRFRPLPQLARFAPLGPIRNPRLEGPRVRHPEQQYQIDELEPVLKPLSPRVFDIQTPDQFRRALATILGAISDRD